MEDLTDYEKAKELQLHNINRWEEGVPHHSADRAKGYK